MNPFALRTAAPDDPEGWQSGVCLARLTASDSQAQSYILFVVRDDSRRIELLVQLSVTTYQAYNDWGGKSLYRWGSSGRERAAKVSFNRPYAANAQNAAAAVGMGAGEFLTNLQPHPDWPWRARYSVVLLGKRAAGCSSCAGSARPWAGPRQAKTGRVSIFVWVFKSACIG